MTEEYAAYLKSETWQNKRLERLKLAKFRCSACRSRKEVQVHHLTYARIFQEEMGDLLPLCDTHHDAAEKLIAAGKLDRNGDVGFLACETLRLIGAVQQVVKQKSKRKRKPRRKPPRDNFRPGRYDPIDPRDILRATGARRLRGMYR